MDAAAAAAHFEEREREREREAYEESPLSGSSLLRRSRDGDVVIRYNGEKKRINVVLSSQPTRAL
jgi:hypothetical protein